MICLWDVDLSLEMSCNLIDEALLNGTWDNACFFIQTPGLYSWSTALYTEQHRVDWREWKDKARLRRLGLNV